MQQALRARIRASSAVTAIVGTKVDWVDRPGLPAVTLTMISGDLAQTMKGLQALQVARVQVDCWAATYQQAQGLVSAVLVVCLPRGTHNGILFLTASATTPRDLGEQTTTHFIYRKQTDLTVRYSPA